jgi:hypothetical protein
MSSGMTYVITIHVYIRKVGVYAMYVLIRNMFLNSYESGVADQPSACGKGRGSGGGDALSLFNWRGSENFTASPLYLLHEPTRSCRDRFEQNAAEHKIIN